MSRGTFVCLLASLSMMGALSIDMYLPALPAIAREFSVTPAAAQQTLTIFLFGYAFMTLFYGTLSDSFGRRPVILAALVLYLGGSLGCALAPSLGWLLVFRLMQGLCAGAGNVVGRAMVGDLFTGVHAQRIMAFIALVFGIAPAAAPILGGWMQGSLGWRFIFFFITAFSLLLLAACLWLLPESLEPERRHAFHFQVIVSNYWRIGGHVRFLLLCLGNALTFTGVSVYIGSASAFIYTILHLSAGDFGWLFIPLIGGMTIGSMLAARLAHRLDAGIVIRLGYGLMLISALANVAYNAVFTARIPWAVLPPFTYCVGMAFAAPAMNMRMLGMFPKTRGLVSSLMSFVFMTLFALVSGVIAPHIFDSALHLAEAILVGVALSFVCWTLGGPHETGDLPRAPAAVLQEVPLEP